MLTGKNVPYICIKAVVLKHKGAQYGSRGVAILNYFMKYKMYNIKQKKNKIIDVPAYIIEHVLVHLNAKPYKDPIGHKAISQISYSVFHRKQFTYRFLTT